MTLDQLILDMKACQQTEGQSVYEHGLDVKDHTIKIIELLRGHPLSSDWLIPTWATKYPILDALSPRDIIEEYTVYHDCGKPYCISDGVRKFPNHAEVSERVWLGVGGRPEAARLMSLDMLVHTMKAVDVPSFSTLPEAATLLLVGLAEVHSNARMFGGLDSTSFKIKWNQIDKRGRAVCLKLFGEL